MDGGKDLPELGVIGQQIPFEKIKGVWMQAVSLLPLSTIEAGKVKAFSAAQPYGVLTVHLWTDPVADAPDAQAMLPVVHKDDYRALHWVLRERPQDDWQVMVIRSPAGGLTGRFKAQIAIALAKDDELVPVKGPQEALAL